MTTSTPPSRPAGHRHVRTALLIGAMSAGAMPIASCTETEPGAPASPAFVADQTYTDIPGVIMTMPDPERPISGLSIAHEHIPEFRGRDGEIYVASDGSRGMRAMTMPFVPAPGVSIEDFEVGDRVLFGFEVDWDGDPRYRLHVIEHAPEPTGDEATDAPGASEGAGDGDG